MTATGAQRSTRILIPALAAAAGALYWTAAVTGTWPRCPVHALTGLDCPGCGTTRAIGALRDGDLAAAFDHNALVVPTLIMVAAIWLSSLRHTDTAPWVRRILAPKALLAVIVGFTVARNIPVPLLDYLAAGR